MMTAFKDNTNEKADEELKAAQDTSNKRQLMVRKMVENEKKLKAKITELEGKENDD